MSQAPSEQMIDRLRRNLADAGVTADEADIQGIVEKGFLSRLGDVEQVLERAPADGLPDYLHAWGQAGAIARHARSQAASMRESISASMAGSEMSRLATAWAWGSVRACMPFLGCVIGWRTPPLAPPAGAGRYA